MLGEKIDEHNANVFLVNTGRTGGEYGAGSRMKLAYTRAMIQAALEGELNTVDTVKDEIFGLDIPQHVPGVLMMFCNHPKHGLIKQHMRKKRKNWLPNSMKTSKSSKMFPSTSGNLADRCNKQKEACPIRQASFLHIIVHSHARFPPEPLCSILPYPGIGALPNKKACRRQHHTARSL